MVRFMVSWAATFENGGIVQDKSNVQGREWREWRESGLTSSSDKSSMDPQTSPKFFGNIDEPTQGQEHMRVAQGKEDKQFYPHQMARDKSAIGYWLGSPGTVGTIRNLGLNQSEGDSLKVMIQVRKKISGGEMRKINGKSVHVLKYLWLEGEEPRWNKRSMILGDTASSLPFAGTNPWRTNTRGGPAEGEGGRRCGAERSSAGCRAIAITSCTCWTRRTWVEVWLRLVEVVMNMRNHVRTLINTCGDATSELSELLPPTATTRHLKMEI
ncbi:hypothetical protein C8F04DRAFT_1241181 [Mycena alexandri]|uniref:Uncharacterized protein n=1 Tax=Mycena alexandri TaxID=1745969 RepID=A0AAD6S7I7_9AGAR|nr:hypothetical protein C8F04DRAFT_1241181 [Mycena alexandri]